MTTHDAHYDLIVLGAGTGNMIPGPELAHLRTAIVEPDRFGGTCLNRGCIPTKMFVVAADAALGVGEAARLGVHATLDRVDWPAIRDRVFGRIDPLHERAVQYRRENGIDVLTEPARFVGPRRLQVGERVLSAETVVVATGGRPVRPPIPGLDEVEHHTSDTVMRLDELPRTMLIVGGGFIAAEFAHVFSAFGAEVTVVEQQPRLLMAEDETVSQRFTDLAGQRHRLLLDSSVVRVAPRPAGRGGVAATVRDAAGAEQVVEADLLLLAVGRRPNSDLVDAQAGGLELDEHGHIRTDDHYRTSVPGVWSIGDATNHFQLKHMANAEGRALQHNLLHPDDLRPLKHDLVPHAVFAHPQVASVGLTEARAREQGLDPLVAVRRYADAAYGWALEDTTSLVKLVADPATRTLLGAHLIGPQAATLIQPLLQAMALGTGVDDLARAVLYIHPALTEVVEQALLEL